METMPVDDKKKRCRHFWKWVTTQKKLVKADVDNDKCLQELLRTEHAREFPSLYCHTKTFRVAESIKEFHRKVLKFNALLREDEDFAYFDGMFDSLALYEGEIDEKTEEAFKKHYFAGYTNFSKHRKGDHRNYQMYYLDKIFKNRKQERKRQINEEKKAKKQAVEEERKKQEAEEKARKQKVKVQKQEQACERLRKAEEK